MFDAGSLNNDDNYPEQISETIIHLCQVQSHQKSILFNESLRSNKKRRLKMVPDVRNGLGLEIVGTSVFAVVAGEQQTGVGSWSGPDGGAA